MEEIFKDVPGWEDAYSCSNIGRIWSKKMNRFLSITTSNHGYNVVNLSTHRDGVLRKKKLYVHRIVAELFVPNPENKRYVDHIDNDKTNNVYTNLDWVTNSENVKKGYLQNKEYRKGKFKKHPVYINTTPVVYFESMAACAKALGLPVARITTVLRYFDGRLPELGLQVFRCKSND